MRPCQFAKELKSIFPKKAMKMPIAPHVVLPGWKEMRFDKAVDLYEKKNGGKITLKKFYKWLWEKKIAVPYEGDAKCRKWKEKKPEWSLGITEEGVMNPDFEGLRCGRIELYNAEDKGLGYPWEEYHICLPADDFERLEQMIENA